MTTGEPPDAPPGSVNNPVSLNRLAHVVRARRIKAASRRKKRRDPGFIKPQDKNQGPAHRRNMRSTSFSSSVKGADITERRGLITMDHCGLNWWSLLRTASRTRRLMRLRTTALPSARGTVKPIRGPAASGSHIQKATKNCPENRLPCLYTRRKSEDRRRRTRFGKPAIDYLSELTVSFLRPRARRRASTARPFFVSIRDRKPCVLARRRLFG